MNYGNAIFWTVLIAAIVWLIVLFLVFRNIADRKDLSIIGKAFWLIVIFFAPVLGLIAYLALGKRSARKQ